jgi:hypothetical protein
VDSFPEVPLELTAEAAFGADLTAAPSTWDFTALTCEHPTIPGQTISRLVATPVTIRRGVTVGAASAQTSTATVTMLNHDGALTPNLAPSPYYPYVDAGTPIRLRARVHNDLTDDFGRTVTGGWGSGGGIVWTPHSGASTFAVTGGEGTETHATRNFLRLIRTDQTRDDCDVVFDATAGVVAVGGSLYIGALLREQADTSGLFATIEFRAAGVVAVALYNVTTAGAATFVTSAAVPSLTYTASARIRLRVSLTGDRIRMRAWPAAGVEPSQWHLDTTADHYGPGRVGVYSVVSSANTNTLPVVFTVDNFALTTSYWPRIDGYIADVRPSFQPETRGTTWSTVQVDIGGIGSRLERRQSPSYSPMRRSIQLAQITPVAYWPLEDEAGSTYAISAFPGGPRMVVSGPAVFGFDSGTPTDQYLTRYGTKPMVSVAGGARLVGTVPLSATGEWAVSATAEFFVFDVPGITEMRILAWDTPGSIVNRWALVATDSGYTVRAYQDSTSTVTNVATWTALVVGQQTYTVEAHQVGTNISVELFANDNSRAIGTVAGVMAPVSRVSVNPDQTNTTASVTPNGLAFIVGHVRVLDEVTAHDTPYYTVPETGVTVTAIRAWYREPAHRRLKRLCDEERVPFEFVGDPGATGMTVLGAQRDGTFSELRDAAAESDSGGLLFEAGFGYRYRGRSDRYNQPAAMTIDLATYGRAGDTPPDQVLVPQLESRAANSITVTRPGGVSGTYAASEDFWRRRGTIAEEKTLDLLRDEDTEPHAAWRVHVNIDARDAVYPSLPIDLAANPDLIDDWLTCDVGSRIRRINQPAIAGLGVIDQVIAGWTETLAPDRWTVAADTTPAEVWDVGVWDDPGTRYAPSRTALSAGISPTAMAFTMAGEPWITGPVSLLLRIGNEDIAISNIAGSGNGPYTVTVAARSVNGVTADHPAASAVTLSNPSHWAL